MPKSVQLSDEAYATLAALKRQGESFSDVVNRLAAERKDPTALLRLGPRNTDFDYAAFHEEARKKDLARMKELFPGTW